jgi:GntR family transcriptional regulator
MSRRSTAGDLDGVPNDLTGSAPKVDQIVSRLAVELSARHPGDEAPSERAIADHFGVARMTARGAVDRLVQLGVVERFPRRGTFVSSPRFIHTRKLSSYADDIRSRGMTPGGHVVDRIIEQAVPEIADELAVAVGAPVLLLVRVRTADDEPMAVTRSRLPLERFPGLEDTELPGASLHDVLLRGWGVRAASHEQRARAVLVTGEDADLLEVPVGSPGLRVVAGSRDAAGSPIETATSVYRGDRYEVLMRTDPSVLT